MAHDHAPGDGRGGGDGSGVHHGGSGSFLRSAVTLFGLLLAVGCADGAPGAESEPGTRAVARARSPIAIAGCFDLHVGEWDAPVQAGRSHFLLPPRIALRFNFRTDSVINDNYRLEPSVRRGDAVYRGRWIYQGGRADSVKLLWSDGREGVLILSETLSNESMTGVAFATFGGDEEPAARAPVSMLRTECSRRF